MTFVITDRCIGTKSGDCIDVCPVDAIHPRRDEADWANANQIFIDSEACIDCAACEPACPVEAVFSSDTVPPQMEAALQRNADYFGNRRPAEEEPQPTP